MRIEYEYSSVPRWLRTQFGQAKEPLESMIKDRHTVLVNVHMVSLDGRHGTLAQAAPTHILRSNLLPTRGVLILDTADVYHSWISGMLRTVLIHELLHVLGMGTLPWWYQELMTDDRLWFTGPEAARQWRLASGNDEAAGVPLEPGNVPGTSGAHWSEEVMAEELFTGFLSGSRQPLSTVTAGALADLGWTVDYSQADPWSPIPLPSIMALLQGPAPAHNCRNRLVLPLRSE